MGKDQLNQEGSLLPRLDRRLHPRKMPVYAIMYMKNRDLLEIRSICPKLYIAEGKGFIAHGRVRALEKGELKMKVECAGINRQEAEDERSSRGGSSEPLGPEFCAVFREGCSEA
jgi:hypothetical protein